MRITRLLLKNFIGIKYGMDRDEIEIKFSDSKRFCMLLGQNGSGKSVILSQLQPYKESFDDRKNLIIDGEEGRKEIDIDHNGHHYEIIHIYSKTAQSFIKKDGVELNENGGVRTFEDIVSRELGITKDYFAIGKIGSNTRSFIDYTTTERKNYIGGFLNIKDILDKYKIVNDKYKGLKKSINIIADELSKYNDKTVIEGEIQQLEKSTEEIDEQLSVLYTDRGSLTTEIEHNKNDIGTASLETLKAQMTEKTTVINENSAIKKQIEPSIQNISDIDSYKTQLEEEIAKLNTEFEVNENNKQNTTLLYNDANNKIASTEIELQSLGNPDDIKKIADQIEESNQKLETLKQQIRSNPYGQFVNGMLKERKDISKLLLKFIDFTDFVEKYYSDLSAHNITNGKSNIEYFFDTDFEESINRQLMDGKNTIEAKQKLLESQQKERGIKEGYVCQLENLKKRPIECNIDDCPFIKDAYLHRNVISEINEKDTEIAQTKKDLEVLNTKLENLQELNNLYKGFLNEYSSVQPRDNDIYIKFISEKSLIEWVNNSLSEFQEQRQTLIKSIQDGYNDITEFSSVSGKIKSLTESKKMMEDSDSTVREKYIKDLETLRTSSADLKGKIDEYINKANTLGTTISEKRSLLDKYSLYIQASSKLASATTMLSNINSEFQRVNKLIESKMDAETKLNTTNGEIARLTALKTNKTENLNKLKAALVKIEELQKKLDELNKTYAPTETVMNALSPSTGIPLIFIKTYLEETEAIANDLLHVAFGNEFSIKFLTTEKEFLIQVKAHGSINPDIKLASQGEISITTIAISLALIEQCIGDYNILCLDEIDGPLDPGNRSKFIDILDQQIDKLGIEQVFIISHNNAFDASPMDLILLKGNTVDTDNKSFMENKNIIFNINDIKE